MKLKKSFLALTLGMLLTNTCITAGNISTILSNIPIVIDDFVAGGPFNYEHDFPEENLQHKKKGYEFKNLVTLGDSLSDQGSQGRKYLYIAGGYENKLYLEYLSLAFTGKHSVPSTKKGLNYALRGASMLRVQEHRKSISEQYDLFLKEHGDKVDSSSLYVLWGGNMDLNILVAKNIVPILTGAYDLNSPEYTLNESPQATADIAQDLINRGAPYVFVPNIPDATIFPYSMLVEVEQIVDFTIGSLKVIPYTWIITAAGRKVDRFIRNSNNVIPGEGRHFFRNNHINAMHSTLYWFLPNPLVAFVYDVIVYVQDKTLGQYNNSLSKALSKINGNIIYFDFKALLNEVAYNYKDYDIDTVLVPTCTLGYSSRFCDISSPEYRSKVSLFSDWFHPSPELHLMIAQTMQAIMNAPVYASSIARQADNINLSREFYINSQLDNLRHQSNKELNKPVIFVGYSGSTNQSGIYLDKKKTHTNILNIGTYSYINPHWLVGAAISLGFGKNKPHNNFRYDFKHQNISFFTQYTFDNNAWLNFNLGLGRLSADDIIRSTLIYKKIVHHKGNTKTYSFNALGRLGIDVYRDEHQQTGPILEIGLNKFRVNAYQEEGKPFLAMKYNKYSYNKKHVGLGWYYHNQKLEMGSTPVKLTFETTINRHLSDKKFKVPGSLVSAPKMFERDIKNIDKIWINTKLGAEIDLNQKSAISSNLGYSSDLKRNKNFNYSIGLKHQF